MKQNTQPGVASHTKNNEHWNKTQTTTWSCQPSDFHCWPAFRAFCIGGILGLGDSMLFSMNYFRIKLESFNWHHSILVILVWYHGLGLWYYLSNCFIATFTPLLITWYWTLMSRKTFHRKLEHFSSKQVNTVHETPSLHGGSVREPLYLGRDCSHRKMAVK